MICCTRQSHHKRIKLKYMRYTDEVLRQYPSLWYTNFYGRASSWHCALTRSGWRVGRARLMSRRLGQGVVTGLDRSFVSTVATYLALPVMLMSSFFNAGIRHNDASLNFVLLACGKSKEAITYLDEAIRRLDEKRPIDLTPTNRWRSKELRDR